MDEIKKMVCCYLLASSAADVYRIAIWLLLGDAASSASWLMALIINGIILNALFKDECKEVLKAVKNKRR